MLNPEDIRRISAHLSHLREIAIRHGQDAFRRQDASEARQQAQRLEELDRADAALQTSIRALDDLKRSLAILPPMAEGSTSSPPPGWDLPSDGADEREDSTESPLSGTALRAGLSPRVSKGWPLP